MHLPLRRNWPLKNSCLGVPPRAPPRTNATSKAWVFRCKRLSVLQPAAGRERQVRPVVARPGGGHYKCKFGEYNFAVRLYTCIATVTLTLLPAISLAAASSDSMETIQVEGSRAEVRKQVQSFVAKVTRMDGDLIGRWRDSICPWVVGLSDAQNEFIRVRLLEVEAKVRMRSAKPDRKCQPNIFVIVTDDADGVLAGWKERDPSMFRWKTREGVSRSDDAGPVRIWHNAVMLRSDDGPMSINPGKPPSGRLKDSRIVESAKEAISAVVVLLDSKKIGKVTLAQTADYIAMVSLSQIDLRADVGAPNTILKLFADAKTGTAPAALTDWDYAFLNALYRVGYYSPMHQRMDISARMSRELAPR
jgi:hypothetical protein